MSDWLGTSFFSVDGKKYDREDLERDDDKFFLNGIPFNGWEYDYYEDDISTYYTCLRPIKDGLRIGDRETVAGHVEFGFDPNRIDMVGSREDIDQYVDYIREECDCYKRGSISQTELLKKIEIKCKLIKFAKNMG